MPTPFLRCTLAAVLLATAGGLAAQPVPKPGSVPVSPDEGRPARGRSAQPVALLFTGFDTDHDARVTRAELAAGTTRMFGVADSDGDKALGLIELANWSRDWLGDVSALPGRFDFDRDGDDRIALAEFAAELLRRFAAMDADKDGTIIRSEMLESAAPPQPQQFPRGSKGREDGQPRGGN